jgi:flavin-dependent dehydrogenase
LKTEETYNPLAQSAPDLLAEPEQIIYDVAVIGGGLAGLSLSIQLAKAGFEVIVFEKERYPFHRVCGEYISLESWNFLENLGYPLSDMDLPIIKNLIVSAPNGSYIEQPLPLGGFGISRYKIDQELASLARLNGVNLLEGKKVTGVEFHHSRSMIRCAGQAYLAKVVCGAFGKRSNLDITWKRSFTGQKPNKLNNYIGVKYHIRAALPADTIALHNFSNGYCGVSQIEDEKHCLCYLTTARNLSISNNSITELEKNILQKNPLLKKIFQEARLLNQTPLTISQVSFEKKQQVENHVLMIGDAAGMITPLCGNGMSMALHAGKIAAELISRYLLKKITRNELEQQYVNKWNTLFRQRLQTGRIIQRFFGKEWVTNAFLNSVKPFPKFISYLIRQTHGEPF